MNRSEIINLIKKNFSLENLNEIKKNYEVSYGKYSPEELKKAIDNEKPFFIDKYFIIGYEKGKFISDKEKEIPIERMVKAVIVESEKDIEEDIPERRDMFSIIGRNDWDSISGFNSIFENLRVGEIFLPPHSAVFKFLKPSDKEIKAKIVSCLEGININVYSYDNYVDNCIHEIGHLFWRDCVKYKEKKKFEEYYKILKPSAIYEYTWEHSDSEEMFCTIYKWYVKSILINKSFYNILEFEESGGLKLLQDVMDRIAKDKMVDDIWELKKEAVMQYLNPKLDLTTGKRIVKKGLFDDIQDIELPDNVLNDVNRFQDGMIFVNLNKAIFPVKENRINWAPMEKAQKINPTIYFDMDGVIADFAKGYKEAFNRNTYEDDSFTVNQSCQQIPHFFAMLPINPKGLELFNHLKNDYNIVFLTTPMENMEYCKMDKIEWIRENIGEYDVLFSKDKADFVTDSESILIDDFDKNIKEWKEAGGTAINFNQNLDKILNIIEETFNPTQEVKRIKSQLKNMDVNTNPSEAQKESGIYKKGVINLKDLTIKIENPKGSVRWGFDGEGRKWVQRMKCHYGYITGTEGSDFDPVDCFIGPHPNKSLAFVVNQGKDGMFDEHKVMLGFESFEEAERAYLKNYEKNWDGLDSMKQTNTKKLREWLKIGNLTEPF